MASDVSGPLSGSVMLEIRVFLDAHLQLKSNGLQPRKYPHKPHNQSAVMLDSAIYTNNDNVDCDRQMSQGTSFSKIVPNRTSLLTDTK